MVKYSQRRLDLAFGALAHPIRRGILARLSTGEATIAELARPYKVSAPAITKHLKILEEAGLLTRRKEGRSRRCRLEEKRLEEAQAWIEHGGGLEPEPRQAGRAGQGMRRTPMSTIAPCLWFDGQAEEAATFYVSVFKNAKITGVARYDEEGARASGRPRGSVMTVRFRIEGRAFLALNGGPHFTFTPAISLMVNCRTQKEIDRLWDALSRGGRKERCGWLRDKFGVSWQIVPAELGELMKDPTRSRRVMKVLLGMTKLDIAALKKAAGR